MRANWQIGSLFGIPLYIDPSWLFILVFFTLVNASDIYAQELLPDGSVLVWGVSLVMALLLFGSVLLHELGHSLVALSQGITVNSITLFLFGGIASINRESKTPVGALGVAIAGPAVSFALFGLFSTLNQFFPPSSILHYISTYLARINLVLAIFNLIPGLPLDGGQVLKAIVWQISGDRFQGIHWASQSGKLVGWFGISLGLFFVLMTGEFGAAWLALIGWFVLRNADAYDRLTTLQESLLKLVAADAMTREFRVVNANLTLRQFAEEYILTQIDSPISYFAASEGRYRGLVKVQDLKFIERGEWDGKTLGDIAHPLTEILSVQENTSLATVINQLEKTGENQITVLSPAGAVAGVIDRGDLVRAVALKHNLSIPESEIKRIKTEGDYPSYLPLPAIAKTLEEDGQS